MPKAGRYEYPTRGLEECINYLKQANEFAKESTFTRDGFATAIKQSSKGGSFNLLVGSLSMYKLVDTGEGKVRYTELAEKILHGEESEKSTARSQAVRNVILFSDIYEKFGQNPSDEQLRLFLREKANVPITEANSLAVEVGKLFKRVAVYIKPVDNTKSDGGDNSEMMIAESSPQQNQWRLVSPYGTTIIKDDKSLKAARLLLSALDDVYPNDSNSVKGKNSGDDHEPEYT